MTTTGPWVCSAGRVSICLMSPSSICPLRHGACVTGIHRSLQPGRKEADSWGALGRVRSCPQGQEGATWEKRHKVWQQGLWESKTTVDMLIQSLTPRSMFLQHKPDLVTQESFMVPTTHRQRSKQDWRSFPPVLTENLPCDRLPECISCSSLPHSCLPLLFHTPAALVLENQPPRPGPEVVSAQSLPAHQEKCWTG